MRKPLDGIRILDLSRLLPGGFATLTLAQLGAEIIKIESLTGDGSRYIPPFVGEESHHHLTINRDKKSIAIDLKSTEGREIFLSLAKTADGILENFRPGVAAKLGIDYQAVKEQNERIVYCSLSGFGQESPSKHVPAFDLNFLASSGILSLSQKLESGKPALPGLLIADTSASLWTVISFLYGLFERERTNKGQFIDLSMYDGLVSLLTILAGSYFADGNKNASHNFIGSTAAWNIYKTKDGKYVSVAIYEMGFWREFCNLIGKQDLISFDFLNEQEQDHVIVMIEAAFLEKNSEEWQEILADKNLPITFVKDIDELEDDPHIVFKEKIKSIKTKGNETFKFIDFPFSFSNKSSTSAPLLGEHTEQLLSDLGYDKDQIETLKKNSVIKI